MDAELAGHVGLERVACRKAIYEQVHTGGRSSRQVGAEGLDLKISVASREVSAEVTEVELTLGLEPKEGVQPYRVSVVYAARFSFGDLPEGLSKEGYLTRNAVTLLLPFAREAVANLTARGTAGPVLLPPINVLRLLSHEKGSSKAQATSG